MKKLHTKKRILREATTQFYKHGFVKASIRDIVQALGVANATLYNHFKNKYELLYNIIEDIADFYIEELYKIMQEYNDPHECLREMIYKAICLVPKNRKQLKIYLDEQHQLPPRLRKMALKKQREIYKIYYNKIKVLKNKGLVKNLDVDVMTFGIFAMINWSARWFKEKGKLSIEEIANQYIQIFFSGILKKEVVKEK